MNDIISTPPAPASPDGSKVVTSDWWPEIDVNDLRDRLKLEGEIPHPRLVEAIEHAVIVTVDELADWQKAKKAAGFERLEDVDPDNVLGNRTREEVLFLSAVAAHAAARLAARHPDLTATREGSERADTRRSLADSFLSDATRAIRSIKREPGTMSELV